MNERSGWLEVARMRLGPIPRRASWTVPHGRPALPDGTWHGYTPKESASVNNVINRCVLPNQLLIPLDRAFNIAPTANRKTPEQIVAQYEVGKILQWAIETLDIRSQEIVYFYFWERFTLRELGQHYLLSTERVRQILHTSCKRMKKQLLLMHAQRPEDLADLLGVFHE